MYLLRPKHALMSLICSTLLALWPCMSPLSQQFQIGCWQAERHVKCLTWHQRKQTRTLERLCRTKVPSHPGSSQQHCSSLTLTRLSLCKLPITIAYPKTSLFPGIKATPCHWVGQTKPRHPLNPWELYISPLNQKTRTHRYWALADAANLQQLPQESKIWSRTSRLQGQQQHICRKECS